MRLDLVALAHDLAVEGMLDAVLNLDNDGLIHLVADDKALAGLAVVALHARLAFRFVFARNVLVHSVFAHLTHAPLLIPSSRSRISV